MMFNRRNFIQGATCLAVATANANFIPLSSSAQSNGLGATELAPEPDGAVMDETNNSWFKIYGWDTVETDQLQANLHPVNDGQTVIRVMHSWRTAWR
jgi:hypothetical protein